MGLLKALELIEESKKLIENSTDPALKIFEASLEELIKTLKNKISDKEKGDNDNV